MVGINLCLGQDFETSSFKNGAWVGTDCLAGLLQMAQGLIYIQEHIYLPVGKCRFLQEARRVAPPSGA